MKIDLRNAQRRHLCVVDVDVHTPPRVVPVTEHDGQRREVYLDWDRAFDDQGHLRKCPACGCGQLYQRKGLPPLTGFVAVLVVAVISLALWSLHDAPVMVLVAVLAIVSVANVLIYFFAPNRLVCYQCRSSYHGMPIRPDHPAWDGATDEQYRPPPPPAA